MSYGRIILGLGVALVTLLALSAAITLAAQWRNAMILGSTTPSAWSSMPMGWGMQGMYNETEKCGEGWHKGKFTKSTTIFTNLTTIEGEVKSVNKTNGFIVVTADGKDYNVRLLKVYVRTSDGALIFGGWILGNIKPGDTVKITGFDRNSVLVAVSITWGNVEYQFPAYYLYLLRSG